MADVADILGVRGRPAPAKASEGKGKGYKPKKPKGMSREVYNLVGDSGLAPMVRSPALLGTCVALTRRRRLAARCRRGRSQVPTELEPPPRAPGPLPEDGACGLRCRFILAAD